MQWRALTVRLISAATDSEREAMRIFLRDVTRFRALSKQLAAATVEPKQRIKITSSARTLGGRRHGQCVRFFTRREAAAAIGAAGSSSPELLCRRCDTDARGRAQRVLEA